jgi:hypothetical protein
MKTQRSIAMLSVGVALAFASTAQADHWAQDATGKTYAANHSTWLAQNAARLRAQGMLSSFRRAHGPGGVAPGGVYTPAGVPVAAPAESTPSEDSNTVCALGDWCG